MSVPPGFTEETWRVAERFCELVARYLDKGLDLDEAQALARETMKEWRTMLDAEIGCE
jgi:aryl carrier-like protein